MANHNGGRHKIEIDWKLFNGFCAMQCTLKEIACYFNCSEDTIERRVRQEKDVSFADYFGKKRITGLISLRRMQFKMAEKSPAMAIFLGKNYLGQADKHEITGAGGEPIKHEIIVNSENTKKLLNEIGKGIEPHGTVENDPNIR